MIKRSTCDICSFPTNSNRSTIINNVDSAVRLLNYRSTFSTTAWMFT